MVVIKNKLSKKKEKQRLIKKGEKERLIKKGEKRRLTKKGEKNKKSLGKKKKPLNAFFKEMLKAKTENKSSFIYKNTKYIGYKHDKLGMIYKKEK